MSFVEQLGSSLKAIAESGAQGGALGRIRAEIEFAGQFAELFPETKGKWQKLVLKAAETVRKELSTAGPIDLRPLSRKRKRSWRPSDRPRKSTPSTAAGTRTST
jgi:hypothetical protein